MMFIASYDGNEIKFKLNSFSSFDASITIHGSSIEDYYGSTPISKSLKTT